VLLTAVTISPNAGYPQLAAALALTGAGIGVAVLGMLVNAQLNAHLVASSAVSASRPTYSRS
jgi:hypothetical protein